MKRFPRRRSSHVSPMPRFITYPLPISGGKGELKIEQFCVNFQPEESFCAFKERVVVRFRVIPVPDVQNPPGLVFRVAGRRQPADAAARPVLLLSFFELGFLESWIPKRPDDMQPDA